MAIHDFDGGLVAAGVPGAVDASGPARIFDAEGREVTDEVFWADTETGECLVLDLGEDKKPAVDEAGDVKTRKICRPAPLRVEFQKA